MKTTCSRSSRPQRPGRRNLLQGAAPFRLWLAVICLALTPILLHAQPALRVEQVSGGFRVSWPLSESDFVLQGASGLVNPAWQDVPNSPEIVGEEFMVVINDDTEERLFRLVNRPLPKTLPTLRVASEQAFSEEQLATLLGALGADPRQTQSDERGLIFFLDPQRFQVIPSLPITDQDLIKRLQADTEEEEQAQLFEAFDMEGLKKHKPLGRQAALRAASAGLKGAGLLPQEARLVPSHTRLSLLDTKGHPLMDEVLLDTQVNFELFHQGIPLTGPGARIAMSFDAEGRASQLLFSFRPLEEGPDVPILNQQTVLERCALLFPKGARLFKPRLMYYTPSVLEATGQTILPCFECAASIEQNGMQVDLLRRMIPAIPDSELLPAVQLEATLKGRQVSGQATVIGGLAPYNYQWISSSVDLSTESAGSVQYVADYTEGRGSERLQVIVTDANGLEASAIADLGTPAFSALDRPAMGPQPVGGVTDFGFERAVSDLGSGIQSGFINRFKQSASLRFNWSGVSSWERDFKQGGTGLDHLYVDNVDLTFYVGHGWPGGFTFESMQSDGSIVPGDVVGGWGNGDLEWLCLVSCQVLKWSSGGQSVIQRWGPAFDGLHMLLGFDTNAYDDSGFGASFANYTLGYDFGFFKLPPLPVRQSWFLAKRDQQPASAVAGTMGPIGPGNVSNCNEYFWGKGSVGPDISKANIQGWWVLYYQ